MNIEYLADYPDALPILAEWQHREWGHLRAGDTVEQRKARLEGSSNRDRIQMLTMGVHMVQDHPFLGVGPEMVSRVYGDYLVPNPVHKSNPHLHNVPMQIAAERGLPALQIEGYAAAACAFARLFLANFTATRSVGLVPERILTVVPVVVAFYYLAQRIDEQTKRAPLERFDSTVRTIFLHAAALLVVALIRFEAGRVTAVIGWALFAVILLEAGLRLRNVDFRYQSYAIAAATFARSWASNFYIPGSLGGIPERIVTSAIVIGCLYACELIAPRGEDAPPVAGGNRVAWALEYLDRNARSFFSLLASALLALLLFYEISGGLLTVAWGLQAVGLLIAGFMIRERVLRLSGLGLFGVCIIKVFTHDLQRLEALPRILSFIVLGALLISMSFVYTRYREQMRRFL